MTRLVADGLTVRRGGRAIVDGVSLALDRGLVAVLGPNGAGKSTLLACLAGLLKPDQGTVSLAGTPIRAMPLRELARRRAYLPQSPRAEWPISVERLVALGLMPQLPAFGGLPKEPADRISRILADMDLADRRDQAVTTLSGGELARAMLARALVGEPEVLIADEPLAGLDPRHALDGARRLRALAEAGVLVLAAMHELTIAVRYATHIIMLRDGCVVAFGDTASTLTSALVSATFDVEACVTGAGDVKAVVDFG